MNDPYSHLPDEVHPFKNFTPRSNPPKESGAESATNALSASDLEKLASMSKDELIALVRLLPGVSTAILTPQEIVAAMKLRLAHGGLNEKDMFKALPLMREWFDRELGKAPQSVSMVVEDKGLGKLSDERLLRLERELARMTGQDAVVIAPEPKKISDS